MINAEYYNHKNLYVPGNPGCSQVLIFDAHNQSWMRHLMHKVAYTYLSYMIPSGLDEKKKLDNDHVKSDSLKIL